MLSATLGQFVTAFGGEKAMTQAMRLHRLGNERHPFTDGAVFFRRDPFGYRLAPASFFFERTIYIDRDLEPMAAAIVRRTLDIIVEEEQEEEKR